MSEPTAPVTVYAVVQKHRRGGKCDREWWRWKTEKPLHFTEEDFRPLAAVETREWEWGTVLNTARRRYDFTLKTVDVESRIVVAKPYPIAASKAWPLERCLIGCGWERCEREEVEALALLTRALKERREAARCAS